MLKFLPLYAGCIGHPGLLLEKPLCLTARTGRHDLIIRHLIRHLFCPEQFIQRLLNGVQIMHDLLIVHTFRTDDSDCSLKTVSQIIGGSHNAAILHRLDRAFLSDVDLDSGSRIRLVRLGIFDKVCEKTFLFQRGYQLACS